MHEPCAKRSHGERFEQRSGLDRQIAARAAAQYGVITLSQLHELGLSGAAVRHRVAAGRLHRLHAGVYAVGHPHVTHDGWDLAAVLACGPGAGLSHRSAGARRGLRRCSRRVVDVITPRQGGRRRAGIDAHVSPTLLPRDFDLVDGIRCTTVARTLLDLAAIVPRRQLERAIDRAEVLRVLDMRSIEDVLARAGRHPGAGRLRAVLRDHAAGSTLTRNGLEEAFLAICRRAGLPRPAVNTWLAFEPTGYEPDFLWRREGLIAEVDGRDVHTTRSAFEHDRRRDQRLLLAGYRVIRFTWRQVTTEPGAVEAAMRALFAQA